MSQDSQATQSHPPRLDEQVCLDLQRGSRRGYSEAVLCEPKTIEQITLIATKIAESGTRTLFTRASAEHAAAIRSVLPDAAHYEQARLLVWPPDLPTATGGEVLVLSAGTSDVQAALEAYWTARYLGRDARTIFDVGVAGLHRLLSRLDEIRSAEVIVVAAGMDGALPSVVAGLVRVPVIGLPTSVGYGAAFGGIGPLLAMLNACAPGVAVVNIDNGYGAGHLAAQIATGQQQVATSRAVDEVSGSI